MSQTPKISVLVPTYNYARFLPEAIESVLAQEFRDYELLIVDDGSTDNTAEAVRPFFERDPRVQFFVNAKNLGMVNNWNYCLQQARGKYIKFLFGDDRLWGTHALGKLLQLLESNPGATLATSPRLIIDERSRVQNLWKPLAAGRHKGHDIITQCLMVNGQNLVGEPSAVMFRKADAARGFASQYKQIVDVEMWFHLLGKGDLVCADEPLCAFRVHDLQQTERNTADGVAWKEHAEFIACHAVREEFPRETVFPILFHLHRWEKKIPAARTPEMLEWQSRLAAHWGDGWKLAYWNYCLRYRLAKPFRNFAASKEKRKAQRQFNQ